MMLSGCDWVLNAQFYRAASLKYQAPDIWHDTTPSHIILTVLTKQGIASTIFNNFGMSPPRMETVTSCSPERTLYRLCYRDQYV